MSKYTPGPWEINWYHCRMDASDVKHAKSKGNLSANIGDVLWRAPRAIGPCEIDRSHWAGDFLTLNDADAQLIAAAPDMLEALQALIQHPHLTSYSLLDDKVMQAARDAINKATGAK